MCLEGSLQVLVGGRLRKNIKLIESVTGTAIFFPPRFPRVYGYTPPGATRRREDEVIITGSTPLGIVQAKRRLHEVVHRPCSCDMRPGSMATNQAYAAHAQVVKTKCFSKEVVLAPEKIDCMILDRLDKVRRITESNGTFILFPTLGSRQDRIRVQGMDVAPVERTIREIMNLVRRRRCQTPPSKSIRPTRFPPPASPFDIVNFLLRPGRAILQRFVVGFT